ncbi:MAG: hypothetical protein WC375_06140 [Methanomassiliicoccales archaeon]
MPKLPQKWIDFLAEEPETGMGYQVITVTLENGTVINNIAAKNCQYITMDGGKPIDFDPSKIIDIKVHRE